MPLSKENLGNLEPSAAVGYLLQVIAAASAGNDVSPFIPELIQTVLRRPSVHPQVRKLAYEVCRHATLSEHDCPRLLEIVRSDTNHKEAEVVAAALRFVPCLPASELANRLVIGEISELLTPQLSATPAVVRAAAVQSLAAVLLAPEVQQAAAGSPGLANTYEGLWDALSDSLLDEKPFVVGLAAAAVARLLSCDPAAPCDGPTDADAASPAAYMVSRLADRAAHRLAAALGPVLEMCALVPAPGQVAVCDMLTSLVQRALARALAAAAGGPPVPAPPPGVPVPDLSSLVASAAAYLSTQIESGDPAARTAACSAVLALAGDLAAAGPAAAGAAGGMAQGLVLGAVHALLQLRERECVEAGLAELCEAVAGALPALTPGARAQVLRQLWPLASRVADVSRRMRIWTSAWSAAVSAEMDFRTAPTDPTAAAPPPPPVPAPGSATASDPFAGMTVPAGDGAAGGNAAAAGVCTAVPASASVRAMLGEPYIEVLMTGKAPAPESAGAFAAAQAFAAASTPSSNSLLSSVTSMTRSAPPPPVALTRNESLRSAASASGTAPTPSNGTMPDGKGASKQDKKAGGGGMFGGRLFGRSKTKAKDAEAEAQEAAAAAAAQQAAAQRAEAAAAAAALSARQQAQRQQEAADRAAASSSTGSASLPSPRGGDKAGAAAAAEVAAAVALARSAPHATLRHELLQALLWQLAHHPAAAVAAELAAEQAAAAAHDRQPPTHASSSSASATSAAARLGTAVQWVAMVGGVLEESVACVAWEPYVAPAITAQPSAAASAHAPVDFNVLTLDLWLGLMQAAVQASRAAAALLGRLVAEAADAAAAAEAAGGAQQTLSYGLGYGMPYGLAAGGLAGAAAAAAQQGVPPEVYYRALLSHLEAQSGELQGLLMRLLSGWSGLAAAARPRLLWVAAHCAALPGHWDDRWALLLGCCESALLRGADPAGASRRSDLLGSALAGSLLKAGRQAWSDPSKPFLFDIASASALCEAPEYGALGCLAALAALQRGVGALCNAVADAVPHGAAGSAHGQAVAVGRRLEALMRAFIGTEAAAAPHVRDWCKRILRSLASLHAYVPPVNLPPTVAALGVIAKQAHQADGEQNGAADDSSDASSAYDPAEGGAGGELPPAFAAAAAAAVAAAAAAAAGGPYAEQQPQQQPAEGAAAAQQQQQPLPAAGEGAAVEADPQGRPRAGSTAVGSSYMVHSASSAVPLWGYPFAPLTSAALHNSKRARRHRALLDHLTAAAAAAAAPRGPLAAAAAATAGGGGGAGPALSCRTPYRLDSEAFWADALPAGHSPWKELTGPADPVLLRGCFARPGQGEPAGVTVMVSAVNRLPCELSGVELSLKAAGPLQADKRAGLWELPSLAAQDRAAASFKFKLLGYGDLSLAARLQLCPGPPRTDATPLQLNCAALELPVTLLLRPHGQPGPVQGAAAGQFFGAWGALPSRAELPGVCTWPGPEGGALLVSALLRQPLRCAWLQHVAATGGWQAGFLASTALGDTLALVVTTQLVPGSGPAGPPEALCHWSFRSNSPDLTLQLQAAAATWLAQLSGGTAGLGGAARAAPPAPSARPPLHPRVAALQQAFAASAAQLASSGGTGSGAPQLASHSSYGLPVEGAASYGKAAAVAAAAAAAAAAGTSAGLQSAFGAPAAAGAAAVAAAGGRAAGADVSAAWLKTAALAEWQRLKSLAA